MKVTNNSKAVQGVWSVDGLVHIPAGKSADVEIDPEYQDRAKSLPFLDVEDESQDEPLAHDDAPAPAHRPRGRAKRG